MAPRPRLRFEAYPDRKDANRSSMATHQRRESDGSYIDCLGVSTETMMSAKLMPWRAPVSCVSNRRCKNLGSLTSG